MKLRFIGPLVAFVGIAGLLGLGLTMNPREIPSTMLDKPAPNFSLPVLANPNEVFSPSDLIGQRWVLNVWASWCVSCRYEHPLLNELARNGATIVGLNYKDEPDKAAQWLAERGDPYVVAPVDQQGLVGIEWGVIAVPETFIIDEAGQVIYKLTGPITPELIAKEFVPLLGLSEPNMPGQRP